jgi:TetR/AcrR family transcriptional regulator, transcriptional repressor for nem operon
MGTTANGMPARPRSTDTASRVLDIAERLVQVRGFNGFSYADVAAELEITKASLHYHFAGKAELGEALVTRYAERFAAALASIDERIADAPGRLEAYTGLYAEVLRGRRMCLCGMLAAEFETLPSSTREAVIAFFDGNEAWLEGVLETGREERALRFEGSARDAAEAIVGGLQGAMLIARPMGDLERFETAARRLVESVAAPVAQPLA